MLTEIQLAQRKNGIGGSDAAKVCGIVPSPLQVYNDKKGLSPEVEQNRYMYWGSRHEPTIRDVYQEMKGVHVEEKEMITSEKYPWMFANIDGWIPEKNAVLECKTSTEFLRDQWGEEGTDKIPARYLIQCAHYAIVTDCDYVDIAVLIGTSDFRLYKYNRVKELEEQIIEKEKIFWHEHILKSMPPKPMTSEEAEEVYKTVSKNDYIYAPNPVREMIRTVSSLKDKIKYLEDEKKGIEESLKIGLEGHGGYRDEVGNVLVSWLPESRKSVDVKALQQKMPDAWRMFLRNSSSRVFRLKKGH